MARGPLTRFVAASLVVVSLVVVVLILIAGSGGDSGTGAGINANQVGMQPSGGSRDRSSHASGEGGPDGSGQGASHRKPPLKVATPARILPHNSAPFSSEVVSPVVNGWMTTNHRRLTAVYAGADGNDRSTGRFGILRQTYVPASQTLDTVDVAGAGPLRITHAPLGKKVETSAQRDGDLQFTSESGISGTLHLRDDTVTLNP